MRDSDDELTNANDGELQTVLPDKFLKKRPGGFMSSLAVPVLRPVLIPLSIFFLLIIATFPFIAPLLVKNKTAPLITIPTVLTYIYKREGIIREAAAGDLFRQGDRIQVFYPSPEQHFLALFSVDKNGTVLFYRPDTRTDTCSILAGVGSRLAYPVSVVVDSVPGPRLVVALFSAQPLTTVQIRGFVAGFAMTGQAEALALQEKMEREASLSQGSVAMLVLN
ncbi:MAG: hypothetical protein MUF22_05780 [Chitinispirillaceae bacterium]|jgi:hypothetical protein|nr:hypothetical protein [Chitinispirillaceae bacterium]